MSQAALPDEDLATMRHRIASIFGGSIGNLIEWYDFYIYNFFALYFAKSFFPNVSPTVQLLNTFGIYALGFLIRPVGGWVLGAYADRAGRRAALMLSVVMMCFGSLLIAVAPVYADVGVWAPVLLLAARLIQGISLGGEYGTSATYLSEIAVSRHRGFYSSFQYVTLIGGQVLGSVTLLVMQQMFVPAQLEAWGWRVPFLIGAACALFGLYLRANLQETEQFMRASHDKRRGALSELLHHPAAGAAGVRPDHGRHHGLLYLHHLHAGLPDQHGAPHPRPGDADFVHHPGAVCGHAAGGRGDFRPDRPAAGAAVVRHPGHAVHRADPDRAVGHARLPHRAAAGPGGAGDRQRLHLDQRGGEGRVVPRPVRALGVGLPYALAVSIFGGTAPYVALWFKDQGIETAFYWYVTALIFGSLLVYALMADTKRTSRIDRD